MSWTIKFFANEDKSLQGTATAFWRDSEFGDFFFSQEIRADESGIASFKQAAIDARNAWELKRKNVTEISTTIKAAIDASDGKVQAMIGEEHGA